MPPLPVQHTFNGIGKQCNDISLVGNIFGEEPILDKICLFIQQIIFDCYMWGSLKERVHFGVSIFPCNVCPFSITPSPHQALHVHPLPHHGHLLSPLSKLDFKKNSNIHTFFTLSPVPRTGHGSQLKVYNLFIQIEWSIHIFLMTE